MTSNASTLTTDRQVFDALNMHMADHYERLPINFTSATWSWLYAGQREILDMMAQYSAAGFGRGSKDGHPFFREVINALADELAYGCGALPGSCANQTVAEGAKALCEFTRMDRVVFMNSGAEAFDTAVKIIRRYAKAVHGVSVGDIIVCHNNFHGRTLGAISASDVERYREGFGPLLPGFRYVHFGDLRGLENEMLGTRASKPVAIAFLTEPVQAEGGINVPPDGYLHEAKKICRKYGALFVLDEIQTGFGRTGETFAWEHDGPEAKPDLMILGKMLSAGTFPISAVVGCEDVMNVLKPGDHGSTFGGTPLACAVVKKVVEIFQRRAVAEGAYSTGRYFKDKLIEIMKQSQNPFFEEVRGRGLLLGIKFKAEMAKYFQKKLLDENILTGVAGQGYVLRFSPPLIIDKEEIDWALPRIEKALTELN